MLFLSSRTITTWYLAQMRGRVKKKGELPTKNPSNVVTFFQAWASYRPPLPQTHTLVSSTQEGGPGGLGAGCLWEQGVEKVLSVSSPLTPQPRTHLPLSTQTDYWHRKRQRSFQQAKRLSFPKCHWMSLSHRSLGETFIGLSSFSSIGARLPGFKVQLSHLPALWSRILHLSVPQFPGLWDAFGNNRAHLIGIIFCSVWNHFIFKAASVGLTVSQKAHYNHCGKFILFYECF